MRCLELNEQLSAHIDGMLDPSLVRQVEEHLRVCAACRAEYEELKATVLMVRELPEITPTPEFRTDLRQKIRRLPQPIIHANPVARPFFRRWFGFIAAAALLLIALGMTALWPNQQFKSKLLAFVAPGGPKPVQETEHLLKGHPVHGPNEMVAIGDEEDVDTLNQAGVTELEEKMEREQVKDAEEPKPKDAEVASKPEPKPATEKQPQEALPISAPRGHETATGAQQTEHGGLADFNDGKHQDQSMFTLEAKSQDSKTIHHRESAGEPAGYTQQKNISKARPLVAIGYTLTLKTSEKDAAKRIKEMVGRLGGYMEVQPQKTKAESKVLRLPPAQVEFFLEDLKQLGNIEYKQVSHDLTDEYLQAQDTFLALLKQEQVLVEELNQQSIAQEQLISLGQQIEAQQRILSELNQSIELAKIELIITGK